MYIVFMGIVGVIVGWVFGPIGVLIAAAAAIPLVWLFQLLIGYMTVKAFNLSMEDVINIVETKHQTKTNEERRCK